MPVPAGRSGGRRGRDAPGKTPFVAAVPGSPRLSASGRSLFIEAAGNNPGVTIDTDSSPRTKRFVCGGSDRSTPQTVAVTARSDADGVDGMAAIGHSRAGGLWGAFSAGRACPLSR